MKKTLLALTLALTSIAAHTQVVTYVLAPAELEGALDFTLNDGTDWAAAPDMNIPDNRVEAPVVFVDDGTEADSLGCNALINGDDIAGKIAVVYRGACEFGLKAFNAQNAGAIGVVIINNAPGAVGMGAGTNGPSVTIPVVMIGSVEGAMLRDEIIAGTVEMLIGSVLGVYEYNLHTTIGRIDLPTHTAMPSALANAGSGFTIPLGTWVRNLGSLGQDNVSVNVTITRDGVEEVYNENSITGNLSFDQEMYFTLPAYQSTTYAGAYEVKYTIVSANEDGFPSDNTVIFGFIGSELLAYAPVDLQAQEPTADVHYRATDGAADFLTCSYFSHPEAGQLKVHGLYTSLAMASGASTEGELIEARIYEWNDEFTGWSNATLNAVDQVEVADYFYEENLSSQTVYVPFLTPYQLVDGQKYLFCSYTPSATGYLGMSDRLDYTEVQATYDQPIYLIGYGTSWGTFTDFTGCSGVGAHLVSNDISVQEHARITTTPFPNPATDLIRIPLNGFSGAADLQVFDLAGNKVKEQRVSVGGEVLTMNVGNFSNGVYAFQMNFDNGQYSTFRVVVTK